MRCINLDVWICMLSVGHSTPAGDQPKPIRVLVETEKDNVELELYPAMAPATVANFLRYVEGGFYDAGRFNRTVTSDNQVKIEIVQPGINPSKKDEFPPVKLERPRDTGPEAQGRDGLDGALRPGHRHAGLLPLHR